MSEALFLRDGDYFIPTDASGSPWSPAHLHGGPPTGLLAYALESAAADTGTRLARLTVDLLRPVPKAPLRVAIATVRAGRRMRVLTAAILHEGVAVSRGTAVFLERREVAVPEYGRFPSERWPAPDSSTSGSLADIAGWLEGNPLPGLHTTVEACLLDGVAGRGYGRAWMRLPVSVVAGIPNSPTVQMAALADFGNGVGQLRLSEDTGCINTDVTLHLHRLPSGEWLGLEARSRMQADGVGLAETVLYDREGPVGRVTQSLLAMPAYSGAR